MYAIDPHVLAALGRSHGVTGRLLASVNRSAFTYPVKLLEGSVTVDITNPIRRKLEATILAKESDPECDIWRTEIRAQYGISLNNFTWIWFTVGTFVLTSAKEAGNGQIRITGADRWQRVTDARFLAPVVTSGLHVNAITDLVEGADGRILCTDFSGKTSQHRSSLWERDRDKAALELAKAIGVDVYFNPVGAAEIRPAPILNAANAWNVYGGDGGVLIEPRRNKDRGKTYNAVVAEGEDASGNTAVRAIARVEGADQTLQYGGAAGQKPRFYRSTLITTHEQAQGTANALLSKVSGIAKTVEIDAFVNPALEGGDTLKVEIEPGKYELHIVESFTIPLGPGGTTMNTRAQNNEEGES
jgi:hypothetical protein